MTNEETHVENVLSNTSTNSDTEMPLIFTIDQVDNSGKPKLYHESYLDFLQSNKDSYPESNQKVETKISGQRVINITQSESSAIEFHNQPSTSKQLFTIQTTIPIQTDSIMHYYDIDPMSCDNVNPGAIKRQRLN